MGKEYDNVLFGGSGVDINWPRKNFIVGEGEFALLEFLKGNLDYPGINGKPPKQIESIQTELKKLGADKQYIFVEGKIKEVAVYYYTN